MEVTLSALEVLADRLLSDSAAKAQEEIRSIQSAHQANIAAFLAAVADRAGVAIPSSAKRISGPDGVKLIWDEPQPTPSSPPSHPST